MDSCKADRHGTSEQQKLKDYFGTDYLEIKIIN